MTSLSFRGLTFHSMCWLCGDQNPDCVAAAKFNVLLFTCSGDHQVCLTKNSVGRLAAMRSTLFLINKLLVASCSAWQYRYTKLALVESQALNPTLLKPRALEIHRHGCRKPALKTTSISAKHIGKLAPNKKKNNYHYRL